MQGWHTGGTNDGYRSSDEAVAVGKIRAVGRCAVSPVGLSITWTGSAHITVHPPETLHDRAQDLWRPLLALAEAVGGD